MYTITRTRMPRKKPVGPVAHFQLKLYGEAAARWHVIRDRAKKRNPYIDDSAINRRLLGLDPDLDGAVTESDRLYFQSSPSDKAEMMGRVTSKTHISEVSQKRKRR